MMYINHTVMRGDTVQRIAQQYGVEKWQTIVELNNLRYPYVISDINLNNRQTQINDRGAIRMLGQTLLIPSDNLSKVAEVVSREMLEESAYGLDLDITSQYRRPEFQNTYKSLYGEMATENGDLKIARGITCLRQAILMRLSTPLGSLELHPYWGSRLTELIGEKRTDRNIIKMRLEIERTIMSDKRVSKVEALQLQTTQPMLVGINCKIYPIDPVMAFRFTEQVSNYGTGGANYA